MLRVMDAPGFYAAFPWGGYAQSKGATGTRSNAIGARALYSPLSPPHLPRLVVYSATAAIHRAVHRGPPPERSGEGGSSLHGPISAMHRTQRAPFDEKHASKTTMIMVATMRLRRSSPRSRGPPSQSESYVWDKALICRRSGESNSSI